MVGKSFWKDYQGQEVQFTVATKVRAGWYACTSEHATLTVIDDCACESVSPVKLILNVQAIKDLISANKASGVVRELDLGEEQS